MSDYTNTVAEAYLVSAILNDPDTITELKGEGITQASFHTHLPKLLWNKLTKLHAMERNHEIEVYEMSDDVTGSPNGHELAHQISTIRGEYSGKQFLKSHIKTVKDKLGADKRTQIRTCPRHHKHAECQDNVSM